MACGPKTDIQTANLIYPLPWRDYHAGDSKEHIPKADIT